MGDTVQHNIRENDYVIIKKGDITKAFQIHKNRTVRFARQKVVLDGIIGHEFGSVFEIKNNRAVKIVPVENTEEVGTCDDGVSLKDNRCLVDDGTSQKLTKDDIESFKNEGVSGTAIVQYLIKNSTTFNEKTEFSQEKYLKKKRKKYTNTIMVLAPSTRLIIDMYYSQGPQKVSNIRSDTLARILTHCNVQAGGKYMVLESCLGVVVGSVLERVWRNGSVVHVYHLDVPQQQAVDLYNFDEETRNCLLSIKYEKVEKLVANEKIEVESLAEDSADCNKLDEQLDGTEKQQRRIARSVKSEKAKELLLSHSMDGLIIASKFSPVEPLFLLLEFLQLSRPFVVYCVYKEPLVECYTKLKESGQAVSLWLSEMWMREYQILPNRTHPNINMSGTGGFLLTGIKVEK